jgi:hypothetical protein
MSSSLQRVPAAEDAITEIMRLVPPIIIEAQNAFSRDLPQLLQERRGQWVAYHGQSRLGFGATKTALYQDCLRRGLKADTFVVRRIEEQPEVDIVG